MLYDSVRGRIVSAVTFGHYLLFSRKSCPFMRSQTQ